MFKKCVKCGKEKEHHAKGMCYGCYRNLSWDPKKGICERCQREMQIHAKGLCRGCYNFVFHSDKAKANNYKKNHKINLDLYKQITQKCVICGFDKIIDLHHLDQNHDNNSKSNMIGLCPNHHKMIHDFRYRNEMRELLKQKGHILPLDKKLDFELIKNGKPRISQKT